MKRFLTFFILFYSLVSATLAQVTPNSNGVVFVTPSGAGSGTGDSWGNATVLHDALKAANSNASIYEIWIRGGVYYPRYNTAWASSSSSTRTFFVRDNLKVYGSLQGTEITISNNGNYPIAAGDTTYLDGTSGTINSFTANAAVVVNLKNAQNGSLLNGLVIMNGYGGSFAGGLKNDGSSTAGGPKSSSVTVNNCIFRNNKSTVGGGVGGAVCNWGNGGTVTISFTNCSFVNNQAAGTVSNRNNGGAVINYGNNSGNAQASFDHCTFVSNSAMGKGGAIENNGYIGNATASFVDCIFKYNQSTNDWGGVLYSNGQGGSSNTSFRNCVFYANKGNLGANLAQSECTSGSGTINIINCSYYEKSGTSGGEIINHSNGGGGAAAVAVTNIYNSIFWKGNGYTYSLSNTFTKSSPATPFTSTFTIKNTILQGIVSAPASSGTYTYNYSNYYNFYPNFIDTVNANLNLMVCSPAMDKGDNSLYSGTLSSDLDLSDNLRLVNPNIDLGAYEVPFHAPVITSQPLNIITTCYLTDTAFSATATGDSLVYQWQVKTSASGSFTNITNETNDTLYLAAVGVSMNGWQYRAIVSNCLSADTSKIVILKVQTDSIPVPVVNKSVCRGDTLYLQLVSLSGSGVTYNWTGPNSFSGNVKDMFIAPTNLGHTGIYTLRSAKGTCYILDTMNVTIDTPLMLSVNAPDSICAGKTLQLNVNDTMSGNNYNWSGPDNFASVVKNPVVVPVALSNSGAYTVVITGKNSCKNTPSKTIIVIPVSASGAVTKY